VERGRLRRPWGLVILSVAKDLCRCGSQRALTEADEAERAQDLKAVRRALTRAVEVYQGSSRYATACARHFYKPLIG